MAYGELQTLFANTRCPRSHTEKELLVNLAQLAETRHLTKVWDPSRTISPEHFDPPMKMFAKAVTDINPFAHTGYKLASRLLRTAQPLIEALARELTSKERLTATL